MDTEQTCRFILEYFAATEYNSFWSAREMGGTSASALDSAPPTHLTPKIVSLKVSKASSFNDASRSSSPYDTCLSSTAFASSSSSPSNASRAAAKLIRRSISSPIESSVDAEDFDWNAILEATSSIAVPETAFDHVERSIESALSKGMILECLVKDLQHFSTEDVLDCSEVYWVAEILMSCGPLVELQFLGLEHRKIYRKFMSKY